MKPPTPERIAELKAERAKLTDPVDRIVFDNRWECGLPVGLWVLDTLTERQLLILSTIAQAESHTEHHCGHVLAALGTPTTERDYAAVASEVHALDVLGLVGTDLCGCDETTAYGITDAGYEALEIAGYCQACWSKTCSCKQCGAPCSLPCTDEEGVSMADMQAHGGGFGGSDG
jgi:hypothetical protein